MEKKKLKIKDIHFIYKQVYLNACELLVEANLLYDLKKYARAYHLAQLALEEFDKLNKLYAQALRLHNKENVTWEGLIGTINNSVVDDDIILGIVLIVEKNYINYPVAIDAMLYQPKLNFPERYSEFKEFILDDTVLVDILNVYKSLNTTEILKKTELRDQIRKHINKYRLNSIHANFYHGEFVIPSKIINKEQCKRKLMSVFIYQRITELNEFYKNNFDLFKFGKEHYKKLARLQKQVWKS